MTSWMRRTTAAALTVALCGGSLIAADVENKATPAFGVLSSATPDAVRAQALDWLKSVGKTDDASVKAFDAVWSADRPTLDKLSDTFALGDADAAKLLADAQPRRRRPAGGAGPRLRRQAEPLLPRQLRPGLRQGARRTPHL